ncbi:MAG: hypothetical protein V1821_02650 [bacterium]
MPEIIPSILAKDAFEFAEKVRKVEGATATIQVDCMNGSFVPEKCFFDAETVKTIITPVRYDLHLMVSNPKTVIKTWKKVPTFFRATFHAEIGGNLHKLAEWISEQGIEPAVAISPETSIDDLIDLFPHLKAALIMGVHPGKSGQKMLPGTLDRIRRVKELAPYLKVGLDGGINLKNLLELKEAGLDLFVCTSSIYRSKNPKAVITKFKQTLKIS